MKEGNLTRVELTESLCLSYLRIILIWEEWVGPTRSHRDRHVVAPKQTKQNYWLSMSIYMCIYLCWLYIQSLAFSRDFLASFLRESKMVESANVPLDATKS